MAFYCKLNLLRFYRVFYGKFTGCLTSLQTLINLQSLMYWRELTLRLIVDSSPGGFSLSR